MLCSISSALTSHKTVQQHKNEKRNKNQKPSKQNRKIKTAEMEIFSEISENKI